MLLGEVASAVGRVHGIDTMGPEFMRLCPVASVVDDADQQLETVPALSRAPGCAGRGSRRLFSTVRIA